MKRLSIFPDGDIVLPALPSGHRRTSALRIHTAFTPQELQAGFRIGECLIEPCQNRIRRHDNEAHLEPRVMDVLVCLAGRAGEVVSRDTLNQQVWGNVVVTDQAVTNCISELRNELGDDRSANRIIETIPKRGYRLTAPVQLAAVVSTQKAAGQPTTRVIDRRWIIAAGVLLLACGLVGFSTWWRRAPAPALISVAVLQFENASGDEALNYLKLALADEIATLLTGSRDLAVRPSGYVASDDPLAAARERHVDHIVTGRYYLEDNDQLTLAIEAQRVLQERVIWRTRITAPAGDPLAMRERIAEGVRQGLLPALGARAAGEMRPASEPRRDSLSQPRLSVGAVQSLITKPLDNLGEHWPKLHAPSPPRS